MRWSEDATGANFCGTLCDEGERQVGTNSRESASTGVRTAGLPGDWRLETGDEARRRGEAPASAAAVQDVPPVAQSVAHSPSDIAPLRLLHLSHGCCSSR